MSRLIVKNLPKSISEERLREIFAEMGQITDLKLKYTRDGVFRRFAFVGYKTQTEAQRVLKHYNNTFIDTSKIEVDVCKDFGDDSKPRPWSKYSEDSSAFQKIAKRRMEKRSHAELDGSVGEEEGEMEGRKKGKTKQKDGLLGELEQDSGFQEFLEVHKSRSTKNTWSNDGVVDNSVVQQDDKTTGKKKMSKAKRAEESNDDSTVEDNEEENSESEIDADEKQKGSEEAVNVGLSDMDYLKKKVTSKTEKADNENEKELNDTKQDKKKIKKKVASEEKSVGASTDKPANGGEFERKTEFTVKLRGLPFSSKVKDIREFLSPLEVVEIRLPKDKKHRPTGQAYVDLRSDKDLKVALSRNKDYIKGRYIEVFRDKEKVFKDKVDEATEEEPAWMANAKELAENEDLSIAETGRLYLRNLSYSCTEEELSELFGKYGPTTEVFAPVDKNTNQSKGFAFITFMMPEHAVQAFNELDGHIFQGRVLHILPAKPKISAETGEVIEAAHDSSYKKKQREKVASLKGKDHNWNTLFLGANAVAEIMADKYNSSKSDILDLQSKGGLALRMALGETQVVAETKEFLTKNGVKLDAFGNPEAKRSKTVMIVKNLQHGTTLADLETLFSPFGQLGRVILPPSGVTALVEFFKLSTAAKAFEKIAYTKFKNVPLYLEWAPADVFRSTDVTKNEADQTENNQDASANDENKEDSESDSEAESFVVFVKNLNFDTDEDTLKQLFSDIGKVKEVTIAKKPDPKVKGAFLSMGYGFVQFKNKNEALEAVKELQNYELDGHALNLKMSHRKQPQETVKRKTPSSTKQKSSKILVRNVPFEANKKELKELFGYVV